MRHKYAREAIDSYAMGVDEFTTSEIFYYLLDKGRGYELNRQQLCNLLARNPIIEKVDSFKKMNRVTTIWRHKDE